MKINMVFSLIAVFAAGIIIGVSIPGLLNQAAIHSFANFTSASFNNTAFEIPKDGYVKADIDIEYISLKISAGCRQISFEVTDDQALSIYNALHGEYYTRPLTHDIMKDAYDYFGIRVLEARIDSYVDDVYTAKIYMQQGSRVLDSDARPSDAAALALRMNATFYINSSLLENMGVQVC
jgi:bifunctional DNase/RNase